MYEYRPEVPRATLALGALAMAALTIASMVVVPAEFDSGYAPDLTLAARKPATSPPTEVAIIPGHIEVIGIREPNVAWALPERTKPNCKPEV